MKHKQGTYRWFFRALQLPIASFAMRRVFPRKNRQHQKSSYKWFKLHRDVMIQDTYTEPSWKEKCIKNIPNISIHVKEYQVSKSLTKNKIQFSLYSNSSCDMSQYMSYICVWRWFIHENTALYTNTTLSTIQVELLSKFWFGSCSSLDI